MEDENSFDPSEFFRHSTLASQAAAEERKQAEDNPEAMETDLTNDLEVSDSDESEKDQTYGEEAGGGNEDSNEGFDIDEFL